MAILHLSAAGVPTGWSVTAVYRSAYGVALAAAEMWHRRSDLPEAVVEVEAGVVKRSHLFWAAHHGAKQYPDRTVLIQAHGYELADEVVSLAADRVSELLRDVDFLIPREQWERRYPASLLIANRFAEWNAACAAGEVKWDPRWTMMMEPPADWTPSFAVTSDDLGVRPVDVSLPDPTRGHRWDDPESAADAMRAMNSGWSFEEALILQTKEPVPDVDAGHGMIPRP